MHKRSKHLLELVYAMVGRKLVEIAPQFAIASPDTAGAVRAGPTAHRVRSQVLWAEPPDGGAPTGPDPAKVLPADFAMSISFGDECSRLTVRGELDVLTAAAFGAFLELATARWGGLVVVDVAELAFIDASGLGQLARVLPRLREGGGALAIVSPSHMVYKLLDLTGLTAEVHVEPPAPRPPPVRAAAAVAIGGTVPGAVFG